MYLAQENFNFKEDFGTILRPPTPKYWGGAPRVGLYDFCLEKEEKVHA